MLFLLLGGGIAGRLLVYLIVQQLSQQRSQPAAPSERSVDSLHEG